MLLGAHFSITTIDSFSFNVCSNALIEIPIARALMRYRGRYAKISESRIPELCYNAVNGDELLGNQHVFGLNLTSHALELRYLGRSR